jgi:leucyl aminopeptidase
MYMACCAGPVWDDKAGLPTGYGASTLAHWALAQAPTAASSSS